MIRNTFRTTTTISHHFPLQFTSAFKYIHIISGISLSNGAGRKKITGFLPSSEVYSHISLACECERGSSLRAERRRSGFAVSRHFRRHRDFTIPVVFIRSLVYTRGNFLLTQCTYIRRVRRSSRGVRDVEWNEME